MKIKLFKKGNKEDSGGRLRDSGGRFAKEPLEPSPDLEGLADLTVEKILKPPKVNEPLRYEMMATLLRVGKSKLIPGNTVLSPLQSIWYFGTWEPFAVDGPMRWHSDLVYLVWLRRVKRDA